MSENSNISWLRGGHTASPWIGCKKVGPSCANCYAETWAKRYGRDFSTPTRCKSFEANCRKWNREAATYKFRCETCMEIVPKGGRCSDCGGVLVPNRPMVFPSLCDWLDDRVPVEWMAEFFQTISTLYNLRFLLLTKRPELSEKRLGLALDFIRNGTRKDLAHAEMMLCNWTCNKPPANIWIGTSAGTQAEADERIPHLLKIPAAVRFVSMEPLIEKINIPFSGIVPNDISPRFQPVSEMIDWVIIGGESGPRFRDCGLPAIEFTAQQVIEAGVPLFMKQDAHRLPGQQGRIPDWLWKYKQMPKGTS